VVAKNGLFGGTVTVSSLLGGRDILKALREGGPAGRDVLVPENLVREGRFLDGLTVEDIASHTGYRLHPLRARGDIFLSAFDWHST
jgi:hypothetical protein